MLLRVGGLPFNWLKALAVAVVSAATVGAAGD